MIVLRKAKEEDIPVIQDLAKRIWPVAYRDMISAGQIEYMLERMYNKGELLTQLQKGHTFLIASREEEDLGFAGFSTSDTETHVHKLHKLYVSPEAHGKGVGKILINEVVKLVRKAGSTSLELNVNRNNKALGFYKKCGFSVKETVDLDIGNGFFMNDYVMEKSLF